MTPRSEQWPKELRDAWARLTPAEERLMLRARWKWRGWVNPGPNPPKPPQYRRELERVTALLYEVERKYRETSACPGAYDAAPFYETNTRESGTPAQYTYDDVYALLQAHPDGITVADIHHALIGMSDRALSRMLRHWRQEGQVNHNGGKHPLWKLTKKEKPC